MVIKPCFYYKYYESCKIKKRGCKTNEKRVDKLLVNWDLWEDSAAVVVSADLSAFQLYFTKYFD